MSSSAACVVSLDREATYVMEATAKRRRRFVPPTASPYGLANARLPHREQQISTSSPKQIHAEITKWALYSIIYTSQVVHITALPFENYHCFHCCLSLSFTLHFYLNFVGSKLQSIQYRVFSWPPDWGSLNYHDHYGGPATISWHPPFRLRAFAAARTACQAPTPIRVA